MLVAYDSADSSLDTCTTLLDNNNIMEDEYVQKMKKSSDGGTVEHEETTAGRPPLMKTTGYMIMFFFWISLSGWMVNFDLGYGGTVLQMTSFRSTFGTCSMEPNPRRARWREYAR